MTNDQCLAIIETIAMVGRLLFYGITREHPMSLKEIEDKEDLNRFNAGMKNMKQHLKSNIDLFAEMARKSQKLSDFENKPEVV